MIVLLTGSPGAGLWRLGSALNACDGARFVSGWHMAKTLHSLWNETEARVRRPGRPWDNPQPPPWVDGAVSDFAELLIRSRAGDAKVMGVVDVETALYIEELQRWLPDAVTMFMVRDGCAAPPDPHGTDQVASAMFGLMWAARWARHIEPTLKAPTMVMKAEMVTETVVKQLCDAIGINTPGSWDGAPPRSRLSAAAMEGFACHGLARRCMAQLGYETPELGDLVEVVPDLMAAHCMGLMEEDQVSAAKDLLEGAIGRQADPGLLYALGKAYAHTGDLHAASDCWAEATKFAQAGSQSWVALLGQHHHPKVETVVAQARVHSDPVVRDAAARWMVNRGLDHEAAEALANVHGRRWYLQPEMT